MTPLTKIRLENKPMRGKIWHGQNAFKLTHPKVKCTHVTVLTLLKTYLRPQSNFWTPRDAIFENLEKKFAPLKFYFGHIWAKSCQIFFSSEKVHIFIVWKWNFIICKTFSQIILSWIYSMSVCKKSHLFLGGGPKMVKIT